MDLRLRRGVGMTSPRVRERMVERLRAAGIRAPAVLAAMREVPRHLFVDEALASRAYEDTALPIGFGQTISQPWVVARLAEAVLEVVARPQRVLEIGTGSGYQAAVLAAVAGQVFSVERIGALAARARQRLREAGVGNVVVRHGDGAHGWPDRAPFDAIVLTAAPEEIPPALPGQLAAAGCIVGPVGPPGGGQVLVRLRREGGGWVREALAEVSFVPFQAGRG
ncbi:protein-L-isoaspartate(D-aspartate) O-methyltransferase [Inmirania thermothiophila]|nr:protein-L-isoaspartate(D-aspartate) O-methyltransferase [Inmirania thermothiophila]